MVATRGGLSHPSFWAPAAALPPHGRGVHELPRLQVASLRPLHPHSFVVSSTHCLPDDKRNGTPHSSPPPRPPR